MFLAEWGQSALLTIPGFLVVLFYVGLLWFAMNRITAFDDDVEIFEKKNYAYLLQRVSIVAAQVIAMLAVLPDFDTTRPLESAGWLLAQGLWVFVAVILARFVVDLVLLRKVNNTELIRGGNLAMAVVESGFYLGLGFLIKGSLTGAASSYWLLIASTVVFSLLGVAFVVGVFWLHELLTKYDMRGRLREGNLATALEAAGIILGCSIVVSVGVAGDFVDWWVSLRAFLATAVIGVVMLYVMRWLIDLVIIRGYTVRTIQETNNAAAAALLAALMVLAAMPVATVVANVL
jgi:uncharacterized membrane protein YjfL (UPF0719 family)